MSEPSVEEIVVELAADIRARAPARFSADYPSTLDFKVGALIADWRKRGEAVAEAREKGRADESKRIEDIVCSVRYIDLGTMFVIDPAEVLGAIHQPAAKP